MSELVVVGSTSCDYVDGGPARPGGAPFYAARALARLGIDATVVTRCAPADRWLVDAVRAAGLPVAWHASSATPAFRITNRAGERDLRIEALAEPWAVEDIVTALPAGVGWIQVAPLWRGEFPAETLTAIAARGRICLDGQGLVRPGLVGPVRLDGSFDHAVLGELAVLHLSLAELDALGLTSDSLGSLGVPEVVVTLGEQGSIVWANGRAEAVPVEPVARADPTGAGDAFIAAYLASRSAGGEPLDAARTATATVCAMLSEQIGKEIR